MDSSNRLNEIVVKEIILKDWYPKTSNFVEKESEKFDYLIDDCIKQESKKILLKEYGYRLTWVSISEPYNLPKKFVNNFDYYKYIWKVFISSLQINKDYVCSESLKNRILNKREGINVYNLKIINCKLIFINLYFRKLEKNKIKNNINLSFMDYRNWQKGILKEEFEFQNPLSRIFSLKFKREVFLRDNYTCCYCGWKNGVSGNRDRVLTIDHIIPYAHGGTSKKENVVTSCLQCNIKKNDRILDYIKKDAVKDKQLSLESTKSTQEQQSERCSLS